MNRRDCVLGLTAGATLAALEPSIAAAARVASPAGADLAGLPLARAAALLRSGKLSPVDLTEACLARIARLDPGLNTFITLTGDAALESARECTAEIARRGPRGPLHGIPLALKDNIDTAGVRTTAASAAFADRVPAADAEVVRRLKAAGAILLGKLNMDECAYGVTSTSGYFGAVHNPRAPTHVAGGSSGGPAAAVAAGLCFGALGTDTGGSIRQPAAYCGVVGLMPTYGRVSARGVMPLSSSLDHVGPLSRTVEDATLLLQAIAGFDPGDAHSLYGDVPDFAADARRTRVAGLRLGRPGAFFDDLDPEVASAIDSALALLARLTAGIAPVTLPPVPSLPLMFVESASYYGPLLGDGQPGSLLEKVSPAVRALVQTGGRISAVKYADGRTALALVRNQAREVFRDVDLLVTPTTPDLPTTIAAARVPSNEHGPPRSARNTTPFNVYGLPTISLPCGVSREGLPIGLQISGPPGGEARVLALAGAFERETAAWRQE